MRSARQSLHDSTAQRALTHAFPNVISEFEGAAANAETVPFAAQVERRVVYSVGLRPAGLAGGLHWRVTTINGARQHVIDWAAAGHIARVRLDEALRVTGARPDGAAWLAFIGMLALWLGVLLLGAAAVFAVAFNWDDMSRLTKLALAQCALVIVTGAAVWLGPASRSGLAALGLAMFLLGALLALFGQTYQTGADPWQLFAMWALLGLPFAIASRSGWFWLFIIVLLNVALMLYLGRFGLSVESVLFGTASIQWAVFGFNVGCIVVWELAARQFRWLRDSSAGTFVVLLSALAAAGVGFESVIELDSGLALRLVAVAAWAALIYAWFRHGHFARAPIALATLVVLLVGTLLFGRILAEADADVFAFFLPGIALLVGSTLAVRWLMSLSPAEPAP